MLPALYRGGVFVGQHGSRNRSRPARQGRPVDGDVDVDKSGALLVANDAGNGVWRVTGG